MKKRLALQVAGFSALIVVDFGSLNQSAAAQVYPQYRLTPQNPKYGDSVSLWIVKGQGTTDCVSMYHASFKKTPETCVTAACTLYALTVSYQEYMPNYFTCNQVLTEHGPRYEFGRLAVGKYAVVDSATNQEIFSFRVSPAYCTIRGTVQTPSSPGMARRADTVSVLPLPVPACTVEALVPYQTVQSNVMAITDAAGRYVIDSIEAWNCFGDSVMVVTRKTGYAESRRTVVLAGKDSVRADFSLKQVATGIGSANILRANKIQDGFIPVYSLNGRKLIYHIVNAKDPFDLRNTNVPRCIAFMRIVDNGRDETRIINVGNGR